MYYYPETILSEIKDGIADGKKGCIIFDFGAILHYANNIVFKISLGSVNLPDQKLNHRYPNKAYRTISRKYGRKVSKIGYPYFFPLKENCYGDCEDVTWLLNVEFGICKEGETDTKETIKAVFPVKLSLAKDKPVCGLSLRLHLTDKDVDFDFETHYYNEETGGWDGTFYTTAPKTDDAVPLEIAAHDKDSFTVLFSTVLEPYAQKPDKLML